MRLTEVINRKRALAVFMTVTLCLVILADGFWLFNQKSFLRERQIFELRDDLQLLSETTVEAILRLDYDSAEKNMLNWATRHEEVVSLKAVAPNGFRLAFYERPAAHATELITQTTQVQFGGQNLFTLEVTEHTLGIDESWARLMWMNIGLSLAAALLLAAVLWLTISRVAFRPMDRMLKEIRDLNENLEQRVMERTAEVESMNEALEEEVAVRRRAEQELKMAAARAEQERAKTEGILSAIGDGVSIVNREFRILYQNQTHSGMLGSHPDETCYKAYHGQDSACEGCPVAMTFHDGGVHTVGRTMNNRHGEEIHIEISTSPLRDESGRITACIEAVRDITHQRRAQTLIRAVADGTAYETGEEFFRLLVRHLASALKFRYAFVGELLEPQRANVRTLAVWAGDRHVDNFEYDLAGTPCREVLLDRQACMHRDGVQQKFPEDHLLATMEAESYLGLPLVSPSGEIMGVLAVLDTHPITDGENPLAILRIFASRAAAELSRLKAESEKDALQAQLIQSQKMESIGMLAGGVAHDFNNLLSTILGYGELAMGRLQKGDALHGPLNYILEAGKRAADLTSQLLAFSRRQVLEMRPVNIRQVMDRMAMMLRRMIGEDVILQLDIEPECRHVMADSGQLEQILMNIAVNARDAMPKGGRLNLIVRNVDILSHQTRRLGDISPGPYVEILASDTGTGMPLEVRDRVFEPFFTTKSIGKGTGLGLSTVYGIVKQHKGHISVESEPVRGTTFRIIIPASVRAGEEKPAQPDVVIPGGKEVILVVDDEPAIRTLVMDSLAPIGYHVIAAASGEAALEMVRNLDEDVDVILTDIVMPGIKGTELAAAVHELKPKSRVVFMSGYIDEERLGSAGDLAGVPFLQKPLTPKSIARKIREVLEPKPHPTDQPLI